MTISVCVAGATGWAGQAVAHGVLAAGDLHLASAVSRSAAGTDLGLAWSVQPNRVPVFGKVADALGSVDVLVDYTSNTAVLGHTYTAVERGVHVVIGSSGLTADEFAAIDAKARTAGVGVVACGNFSLTAVVAQISAITAARYLPSWEIVDYASAHKADAPSGTARELAERLSEVRPPALEVAIAATHGSVEARGVTIGTTQVHSVRLPSFSVSTEIIFALPGERLVIRHDGGEDAAPFVAGTLLAIRAVTSRVGLTRGLDTLLEQR